MSNKTHSRRTILGGLAMAGTLAAPSLLRAQVIEPAIEGTETTRHNISSFQVHNCWIVFKICVQQVSLRFL